LARTLVCENDLRNSLYFEAINTTNYVLNRCLIRPILKKTPYELFKGKKVNVSYFLTLRRLKVSVSSTIMARETLLSLMQAVMKIHLLAIRLLEQHIAYIINVPSSLSNLFMLSLMKLTVVLLVYLHLMSFK